MTEQKIDTGSADSRAAASEPHAAVGIDEIIAAATALAWAARWDIAARLLTSAQAPGLDDATVRRLALARAAVAVHHDFRTGGGRWAPAALTPAERAAASAPPAA